MDELGNTVMRGQIFDPFTQREVNGVLDVRDPFPNNRIPNAMFDPVAAQLIGQYPAPNHDIAAPGKRPGRNFFTQREATRNVNQFDVRIDHRISDSDSIFGSVSWIEEDKMQSPPLPGDLDAGGFLGEQEKNQSRNAMISYTKIWSPALITESRVSYSRLITTRTQANADSDSFSSLGIGGLNPFTTNNGGLMRIGPQGYSTVGGSEWLPTQEYSNVWDFIQNVSWNKGAHAFKFGAEYRPIGFPFFQVPSPRGRMDFRQDHTNQVGFNDTGDGMASWLLGVPGFSRITTSNFISSFKDAYSFYAQDDWKVSSKLTVNIGIRYEVTSPIGEKFGRQAHLDVFGHDHAQPTLVIPMGKDQDAPLPPNFATDFPGIAVERGVASTYLTGWDKSNIAPRIGFAYEAQPGLVVRAGFGMFYGAEENEGGNPNRGENVPFNQEVRFNPPRASARNPFIDRFSDGFPVDSFTGNAPISFRSVYTRRRWPLVNKWNLNIQRDMGWNSVMEIAYIGSKGNRLTDNYNGNQPVTDPRPNIDALSRRPFKFVGNSNISFTNSNARSAYHALTAKWDRRFSNGLGFLARLHLGARAGRLGHDALGRARQPLAAPVPGVCPRQLRRAPPLRAQRQLAVAHRQEPDRRRAHHRRRLAAQRHHDAADGQLLQRGHQPGGLLVLRHHAARPRSGQRPQRRAGGRPQPRGVVRHVGLHGPGARHLRHARQLLEHRAAHENGGPLVVQGLPHQRAHEGPVPRGVVQPDEYPAVQRSQHKHDSRLR